MLLSLPRAAWSSPCDWVVGAALAPPRSRRNQRLTTETHMARSLISSQESHTSWTLERHGQRLTCTLTARPSGEYVLRLTHQGQRILDELCDGPQHAISRSLDTFGVLIAGGWLHEPCSH